MWVAMLPGTRVETKTIPELLKLQISQWLAIVPLFGDDPRSTLEAEGLVRSKSLHRVVVPR